MQSELLGRTEPRDPSVLRLFTQTVSSLADIAGRVINSTKMNYASAESSYHNLKFGKTLVAVGDHKGSYDRVIGHRLEIVPQADPFALKVGDNLKV
jgi:uncharacterized GH25 family protein